MVIRLSLLLSLCFLVACGADSRKNSPVFVKGQIKTGMPEEYNKNIGIISGLKRLDLFLDTDKDGILDRDDFDIDNDNIPNDCDLAPFEKGIGAEDRDQDGIPDFCDLDDKLQQEAFEKYGILLNLNEKFEKSFHPEDLKNALAHISTRTSMPSQLLVTLTLTDELPKGEYGLYDEDWRHIRLRPDNASHDEFSQIKMSTWTLVHELFHFVGATNSKLYSEFGKWYQEEQLSNRISFPTEYSKISKEEYFAESLTLEYFSIDNQYK